MFEKLAIEIDNKFYFAMQEKLLRSSSVKIKRASMRPESKRLTAINDVDQDASYVLAEEEDTPYRRRCCTLFWKYKQSHDENNFTD